ncbi:MAG: hypothetical protein L3J19_01730 [Sulfurimonas sp.]|nr:hypothetical protein [Sulfurimonas sp.]
MYNLIILFFLLAVNLYADKKWISLEPISAKQNINPPQMQPIKKLIKNAKIIKRLVDHKGGKKKLDESGKNWYPLEN